MVIVVYINLKLIRFFIEKSSLTQFLNYFVNNQSCRTWAIKNPNCYLKLFGMNFGLESSGNIEMLYYE